jgi:hypothetical protein
MLIARNLLMNFPGGEEMDIDDVRSYVKKYLERIKLKTEDANLSKERICLLLDSENINKLLIDPKGGIAALFAIDAYYKFTIILMAIDENGELISSNGVKKIAIERWDGTSSLTKPVGSLTNASIDSMIK